MIVVDIGNSNIHLGIYEDKKISRCEAFCHRDISIDDLIKEVNLWIEQAETEKKLAVACVYDPMLEYFGKFFREIPVFQIDSAVNVGVKIFYEPKSSLGVDRFANLVAFRQRYETAGIIVDIGSALTIDLIDKNGSFKGGIIFPGPALSSMALAQGTDRLPKTVTSKIEKKWGNSTEESILCGVYSAYKVLVDGLIDEAKKDLSNDLTVIVTGGWSNLWKQDWAEGKIYDKNLTLKGVGDIYRLQAMSS